MLRSNMAEECKRSVWGKGGQFGPQGHCPTQLVVRYSMMCSIE
jgi:hypothetical protein